MKIAINAASARMGGAATYLQNILPKLRRQLGENLADHQIVVWKPEAATSDNSKVEGVEYRAADKEQLIRRLRFDQVDLPRSLKIEQVDVLFSSANFGTLFSPCRQILLVRNTVYFDSEYHARIPSKKALGILWLQKQLCLGSMAAADVVVFPSQAMMELAASATGGAKNNWHVNHYGARPDLFAPADVLPMESNLHTIRLLNVSLYCDQKNLGTLLSAAQLLNACEPQQYHVSLTAGFYRDWSGHPTIPNFEKDFALFQSLEKAGLAEDSNWQSYGSLPALYQQSDIFVFPSYTESFGHPLVEAMAAGVPIVAADTPINREMCGEAAIYFSTFEAEDCARAILNVTTDEGLRHELRERGLKRAQFFSWEKHVSHFLSLCHA